MAVLMIGLLNSWGWNAPIGPLNPDIERGVPVGLFAYYLRLLLPREILQNGVTQFKFLRI